MFFHLKELLASRHRPAIFIVAYVLTFVLLAVFGSMLITNVTQVHRINRALPHGFMTDMTYYDLPRLTVSMSGGEGGGGKSAPRVRMDISLEVPRQDIDIIDGYQPHITERIGDFVRTLKVDQVNNARSMIWLHDEILKRINNSGVPVPVHEVFFRELLVM
ncbi:MAG: flagellar basal body-associated FliL family protein [Alphaproteobacteria bacterium]|nr:flagellar basal body-associated FliL family protein [Alphaproteobacteria bacterium]